MFYSSKFNSIRCLEFYETKRRHDKKPIFIFLVQLVVTLQLLVWLSTKIFKSQYFGFCSSDLETENSSKKLSIKRIHGEKPIFIFWVFTSLNPCDSSTSPRANFWLVTPEKVSRHGFSVFHQNLPFSFESQSTWHFDWLI